MFLIYLGALVFGGFCGWMAYTEFRDGLMTDWRDRAEIGLIAAGAACVVVTAVMALLP